MYITEGNADAARVAWTTPGDQGWSQAPVMTFAGASAAEFWLGRTVPSQHNLSAPDIVFGGFRRRGPGAGSSPRQTSSRLSPLPDAANPSATGGRHGDVSILRAAIRHRASLQPLVTARGARRRSCACGAIRASAEPAYSKQVEDLLAAMTIEEKVGQLTLLSSDHATTGPYATAGLSNAILRGEVGGVFNVSEEPYTRSLQQAAVEQTRLGIPLLLGTDVLHGYRTIFPIPLGQAASFDLEAIRDADRISAREAAAAGINWVFAPMLDVARDPRWGRIAEGNGESAWLGARIATARISGPAGRQAWTPTIR